MLLDQACLKNHEYSWFPSILGHGTIKSLFLIPFHQKFLMPSSSWWWPDQEGPCYPLYRTLLVSNKAAHFLRGIFSCTTYSKLSFWTLDSWSYLHLRGRTWNILYNYLQIFLYPEAEQSLPLELSMLQISPVAFYFVQWTWIVTSA